MNLVVRRPGERILVSRKKPSKNIVVDFSWITAPSGRVKKTIIKPTMDDTREILEYDRFW